jgi:energy-coupling factor transporter ATP-binding protein EcfA2
MATHNADIVNELKHRVIHLKDGKIETDVKKGKYEKTEKVTEKTKEK